MQKLCRSPSTEQAGSVSGGTDTGQGTGTGTGTHAEDVIGTRVQVMNGPRSEAMRCSRNVFVTTELFTLGSE